MTSQENLHLPPPTPPPPSGEYCYWQCQILKVKFTVFVMLRQCPNSHAYGSHFSGPGLRGSDGYWHNMKYSFLCQKVRQEKGGLSFHVEWNLIGLDLNSTYPKSYVLEESIMLLIKWHSEHLIQGLGELTHKNQSIKGVICKKKSKRNVNNLWRLFLILVCKELFYIKPCDLSPLPPPTALLQKFTDFNFFKIPTRECWVILIKFWWCCQHPHISTFQDVFYEIFTTCWPLTGQGKIILE